MVFVLVTIIDSFDEICILIMIHKLNSKLIFKTKKKVIIVVVKYLAFIFGSHFAYSSIKIEFKLHTKIKYKNFYSTFSTFSFSYSIFNKKKSFNF